MGLPVVSLISPLDLANSDVPVVHFDAKYEDAVDSLVASSVIFEIDTVNTFDSGNLKTVTYSDVGSGTTLKFITTLANGTWYWRVTATNAAGNATSSVYSLTIAHIIKRVLYQHENVAKTAPGFSGKRVLYQYENVAKYGPDWTKKRSLYQYENITDEPPFPLIESVTPASGEVGQQFTIVGNGFGAKPDNDPVNEDRAQRGYGGTVVLGDVNCTVISWSWQQIVCQVPQNAATGKQSLRVQLTVPDPPGVRVSNSVEFSVLGKAGTIDVGIEFRVAKQASPSIVEAILENAKNKSFQTVLSDAGAGRFLISRTDLKGGDRALVKEGNVIRCWYDGLEQFAWVIENLRPVYVESSQQEMIEVSGRGVLSVLERAIVYPNLYPNHVSLERNFKDVSAASVIGTLIQEAQARGVLTNITYDFTGATDSAGVDWGDYTVSLTLHAGEDLLTVVKKLHELSNIDFVMDSELTMHAYVSQGSDKKDTVIYEPGRGILDMAKSSETRGIINSLFAEGDDGIITIVSDAASQTAWGVREGYLMARNIADAAMLADYSAKALATMKDEQWGLTLSVDSEPYRPLIEFGVGDTIRIIVPSTEIDTEGFDAAIRVVGITLEEDEVGAVHGTLDLNSMQTEANIRAQKKLDRLASSSQQDTLIATSGTDKKVKAPLEAEKGDILVYSGTDWVRLPVGTDGQVLTADSTQDAGIKWV